MSMCLIPVKKSDESEAVLRRPNKSAVKSHLPVRLSDVLNQLLNCDVRRLMGRPPTLSAYCHLGVIFSGQKLWGCIPCTVICADLSPPPACVVPETRDPLKLDDNIRGGGECLRG